MIQNRKILLAGVILLIGIGGYIAFHWQDTAYEKNLEERSHTTPSEQEDTPASGQVDCVEEDIPATDQGDDMQEDISAANQGDDIEEDISASDSADYVDEESTDNPRDQASVEEPDKVENDTRVYDHWMDFSEEWNLPYADEEIFEIIKTAYAQVDFFGEFEIGNQEVYDEYKEKYKELLENNGLIFNPETGTNVPFSQIDNINYYIEDYGLQDFDYYFFDIDGDELPELGIHIQGKGKYILDYDSEKDVYSVWYPMGSCYYSLIGTKKVQWQGDGKYLAFYLLDESGNEECHTFFFSRWYSEEIALHIVMLPAYAEKERNTELTETMKSQGIYERCSGQWYFRITKEQYDELSKPYWEAYHLAEEKKKGVTYTYEELFGEMNME